MRPTIEPVAARPLHATQVDGARRVEFASAAAVLVLVATLIGTIALESLNGVLDVLSLILYVAAVVVVVEWLREEATGVRRRSR